MYIIATKDFKRVVSPSYSFVVTSPKYLNSFSYSSMETVSEKLSTAEFALNSDGSFVNCNHYRLDDLVICEVNEESHISNRTLVFNVVLTPIRGLNDHERKMQYRRMVAAEFIRVMTNGSSVYELNEPYIDELDEWAIQQYFQNHVSRLPNYIVIIPELYETYGDDDDMDERDSNIIAFIRKEYNFTLPRIFNPDSSNYSDIGFFSARTLPEVTAASLSLKKMPIVIDLKTVFNALIKEMTEIPIPIEFSKIRNIRQYL